MGPGMVLEEVDGAASFVWREGEVHIRQST